MLQKNGFAHTSSENYTLASIEIQRGRVSKAYSKFEGDLLDFPLLRADGVIKQKVEKRRLPPKKGMKTELTNEEVRSPR